MSNRRLYYKHLQLGDLLLKGHEELGIEVSPATFGSANYSNQATVSEGGANARFRLRLEVMLKRAPTEEIAAFMERKIDLASQLMALASSRVDLGIYTAKGDLAVINDATSDLTAADGSIAAGSGVALVVVDDIFATGDLIWIGDPSAELGEVATVDAWDGGSKTITCDLVHSYADAVVVAKAAYVLEDCYLNTNTTISGQDETSFSDSKIDLTFEGIVAPRYE